MRKYRKKPVVIEAIQYDGSAENIATIAEWSNGLVAISFISGLALVVTLEGTMTAKPGDWIIKGGKGEFYPCKPDIFEATYELVDT